MKSIDTENKNLFSQQISEKEKRKLKAKRESKQSVWSGLGMFGMIGWSVAVPTVLGIALGIQIDKKYPEPFSWTLTFLILGLIMGCFIAWHWIEKENKEMNQDLEEKDE
ncbi:MAG: AtpZ/AtpI family protein [Saprospiraceae bacterium]